MNHNPHVSVIIPTFNRSEYLNEAVASVLAQSYSDFEIIVVDDGSLDNTAEVVNEFKDERIIYVYQDNKGRSIARNYGLKLARGTYIAFLDDDDLYLSEKLAVQVKYLESHPEAGLVAGGAQMIAADGSILHIWENWKDQPQLTLPKCLYACPILTCSVLFRKRWLELLHHWFDSELEPAEDTDFWIRLLLVGCTMVWMPTIVCSYRQHPNNSQQNYEPYYRSHLLRQDKLFTRVNLPESVRVEKQRLYSHHHIIGACHAFIGGQYSLGQERLLRALAEKLEMPDIQNIFSSSIVAVAQGHNVTDPIGFINIVFDNLPSQFAVLKGQRFYALSSFFMQRVFSAREKSVQPVFRDWLLGVYYDSRWLANRGVWSILFKDILWSLSAK